MKAVNYRQGVKKCEKKPWRLLQRFKDNKGLSMEPAGNTAWVARWGPVGMNEPGPEPGRGEEKRTALNASFERALVGGEGKPPAQEIFAFGYWNLPG